MEKINFPSPRGKNCKVMSKIKIRKVEGTELLIEVLMDIQNFIESDGDKLEFSYKVVPSKVKGVYYIKFYFND
jgi:hypothetical protein